RVRDMITDDTLVAPDRVEALVTALAATVSANGTLVRMVELERKEAHPPLPVLSIDAGDESEPSPDGASATEKSRADLQVLGVLGTGGMGAVYAARQRALAREVAVKRPLEGATPQTQAALVAEGRVMGGLEHPNIVPVHALGSDREGRPLLVMKRVEGV